MALSIPFFDYPRVFTDDRDKLIRIFTDIGERGAFILQKDVSEFEHSLTVSTKSRHCVGVANATDGLELCWMEVGIQPGDEVIISSHTMLATASAIATLGGVPVPVDIGPDGLMNPDAVEDAITPRTIGLSPTQLNGRTCEMDRILSIADKHGLAIVEDSAQALGSMFDGRYAGTFGRSGVISFFPAKILGSLGDGGAILTQDSGAYARLQELHNHGLDASGTVQSWGRNSRLDNLQAAVLSFKLELLPDAISRRRQIASMYQEQLGHLEQLSLPPDPGSDPRHFDTYQNYELVAEKRDSLRAHLAQRGVGTLVQWGGKAVHQFPSLGFSVSLPAVEAYFEGCLMLPMNTFISDDDVGFICETVRGFYGE